MYRIEKSANNVRDGAKLFEEMYVRIELACESWPHSMAISVAFYTWSIFTCNKMMLHVYGSLLMPPN